MNIAIYVSHHGFGHAARMSALAEEFCAWGINCHIVCAKPEHLFNQINSEHFTQHPRKVDIGVIHGQNLCLDLVKTRSSILELMNSRPELISREVDFLRQNKIDLVISDAPFIVGEAAHFCNIPWFVVSNFDWYYIYSHLFVNDDSMLPVLNCIRGLYRQAEVAFRLPFSSSESLGVFSRVIRTGLLARKSHEAVDIREQYQIPAAVPLLLVMFGGEGSMEVDYQTLCTAFPGYVLSTQQDVIASNHITIMPEDDFPGLIEQCQIVLCKPGYSTFAEAVQFGKYILYSPRKCYPEEDVLLNGLKKYPFAKELPSLKLSKHQWKSLFNSIIFTGRTPSGFRNENHKVAGCVINEVLLQSTTGDELLSVIDLGSHNLNYTLYDLKHRRIVHQTHYTTGLSIGYQDHVLSKAAIKQTKDAISKLMKWEAQVSSRKVLLATGVSRTAINICLLKDWFEKKYAIPFNIIAAKEEAELVFYAVKDLTTPNQSSLAFDIGGATTELVHISASGRFMGSSLPIGLVRLDEEYDGREGAMQYVHAILQAHDFNHIDKLYGVGLTMIYLAAAIYNTNINKAYMLHGRNISKHELLKLQSKLHGGEEGGLQIHLEKGLRISILRLSVAFCISLLDKYALQEIVVCTQGISAGYCLRASSKRQRSPKAK